MDEYLRLEDPKELDGPSTGVIRIKISTERKTNCEMHPDEKRNLFCNVHSTLCCSHCILFGDHVSCKDHITSIQQATQYSKSKVTPSQLALVQSNISKNLTQIEDQILK